MKQSLMFLFFLSSILNQVSCVVPQEQITKINNQSQLMNEAIQKVSNNFIKMVEQYNENLKQAFKNVSSLSSCLFILQKVTEEYKDLNLELLDNVNSCDGLKLRFASSLIKFNKYDFISHDEQAAWELFNTFYTEIDKEYHDHKAAIDVAVKNVTVLLAKNKIILKRNELHSLIKNLSKFQQEEIESLINSCSCPFNVSSADLSRNFDEYEKVVILLSSTEHKKEHHNELMRSQQAEIEPNITTSQIQIILSAISRCNPGYPTFYFLNTSFWSEQNNSCFNLEMDLADQQAKIWRNSKIIDVMEKKGIFCLCRKIKGLSKLVNELKPEEKKLVEEYIEVLVKYKDAYNDHFVYLQTYSREIQKLHESIKKIHKESCSCKK